VPYAPSPSFVVTSGRKLAQNRLAADDDDFVIAGDVGGRTDDVFQLLTRHPPLKAGGVI
jgi:hypothetical protein